MVNFIIIQFNQDIEFRAFSLQPYNYIVNCFEARNQEFLHENQFDLVLIKLHAPVSVHLASPGHKDRIGGS